MPFGLATDTVHRSIAHYELAFIAGATAQGLAVGVCLKMRWLANQQGGFVAVGTDAATLTLVAVLMGGMVVGTDSFTLSDLGGRDNVAFNSLTVDGVEFDSLRLYGTFGSDNSGGRMLLDNLTINSVPAPGSMALLLGAGGLMSRRRR